MPRCQARLPDRDLRRRADCLETHASKMHLTDEQLRSFGARQASPDELLDWSDHVAACDECRNRLVNALEAPAGARSFLAGFEEATTHLTPEELGACVDETLDPDTKAFALHHLSVCRGCREELEALRAFQQRLETTPARARTRRGEVPTAGKLGTQGFLARLARWFAALPRVPVAIASVAVLAAVVAATYFRGTQGGAGARPEKLSTLAGVSIRDGAFEWRVDPEERLAGSADLPAEARVPLSEQKARWTQLPNEWKFTVRRVSDPDPASPEGKDAARMRELRQKWRGSPLVMGMIYAQRGSFMAAQDQFERALEENRENPRARRLIEDLLQSVREKTKAPPQP